MTTPEVQKVSAEMIETHKRLQNSGAPGTAIANIGRLIGRIGRRLSRPPRVVILGEFNSGKTTLANAILGAHVLPTSWLNNTSIPVIAQYAEDCVLTAVSIKGERETVSWEALPKLDLPRTRMLRVGLPLQELNKFEVIDTPGLATGSAVLDTKSRLAAAAAHIAIWCTPATQAWKASELAAWRSLPDRLRDNAILAVTYIDTQTKENRERLEARMRAEALPHFSDMAMIAGQDAYHARINAEDNVDLNLWKSSGGAMLNGLIDIALANELGKRVRTAQELLQSSVKKAGIVLPRESNSSTPAGG